MTKAAVQKHPLTLLIHNFLKLIFLNLFSLFPRRFTAKDVHFPGGELRLECTAEIEGVWKAQLAAGEVDVLGREPAGKKN